jgi:hypothetical protein
MEGELILNNGALPTGTPWDVAAYNKRIELAGLAACACFKV